MIYPSDIQINYFFPGFCLPSMLYLRVFENPFDSVIENLPSGLQMEVIDLQSSDFLKDKFDRKKEIWSGCW